MTFLPIVERELRVTARRRATYWVRTAISLLAIVTGGWIFLAHLGEPERKVGPVIFIGLSVLAMLCSLLAGRFTTVDCLSEEKRDGTLGLLFLTDLKGYDVVLGKLVATSLNGFFGLLAMFPVLAVTLLMGGTSSGEFWRMVLVLANTFLFSLALGIFASSLCREMRRSVAVFILLLMFCLVVMPGIAGLLVINTGPRGFIPQLCAPSPGFACVLSYDFFYAMMPEQFWLSVGITHGLSWLFVIIACIAAPRTWQDLPAKRNRSSFREVMQQWSYGNAEKRAAFRRRLLNINAFFWLAARDRLKPHQVWFAMCLMTIGWFCGWLGFGFFWMNSMVVAASAFILNTLIKLWVLVECGQRLAEERKMGSLELLLTTPLTVRDILRGQRLALQRQFLLPILVSIVIELTMMVTCRGRFDQVSSDDWWIVISGLVMLMFDVAAIYWVSLMYALRARNPNQASVSVLLRLMILPWVFFGMVLVLANLFAEPPEKFYVVLWFILGVGIDLLFGVAAWRKLRTGFRAMAVARAGRVATAGTR